MVIYAVTSVTMSAIFALMVGALAFIFLTWFKKHDKLSILLVLLILFMATVTYHYSKNASHYWQKNPLFSSHAPWAIYKSDLGIIEDFKRMPNVSLRMTTWRFYINGILHDVETLLLGHAKRPPREKFPSAHNYYLDLTYNFGFIAAIPILGLLVITIRGLIRNRKFIFSTPHMQGLTLVTLFLVLVDNSLKVGLRQPYPGIITFFLWGLLLSRLKTKNGAPA
jgi:Ca2+/Na+ antiporter